MTPSFPRDGVSGKPGVVQPSRVRRHPPEARIAPCIGSFNTEPTPSIGERSQQLHPPPRNLDRPARSGAPGRYLDKVRSPPTPNLGGRQRSDGGPVPDFGDLPEIFQVSSITRADDYPCPAVEATRGSDGRQSWNYDKCADVTGRSTTPGALVHQWVCANDDHQLWAPVNIDGVRFQPAGCSFPSPGRWSKGRCR